MSVFKRFINKLSNIGGEKLHWKLVNMYLYFKDFSGREHVEHLGKLNPEKTFYCIRKSNDSGEGLLSVFTYIMARIDFADRNNMIPYVDDNNWGKTDSSVFNRYFKLKSELEPAEIFKSKNVMFSGWNSKPVYPGWCNWINLEFNEEKKKLFDKYIDFTDEIKNAVNRQEEIIKPNKCLGLYIRGTDYLKLKPSGHPIQPTFSELKNHIDNILAEENLSRIFLVTEDNNVFNEVVDCYGEKVVTVQDDVYWNNYKNGYIKSTINAYGHIEENNILYLTKIILLSKCNSFVGGRTNGSSVANALNGGKYKSRFVYDVGYYK